MPRLGLLSGAVAVLLTAAPAAAQTTYTWNTASADPTWLVPGNWTVGGSAAATFPGLSANGTLANGTATDVAVIGAHAFSYSQALNIDMAAAGGQLSLGAIQYTGTGTSGVLSIGNASATPGLLRLNGATVAGVLDVLLAATGTWDLRVLNPASGGGSTMGLVLGTTDGVFLANTGNTLGVYTTISEAAAGSSITVRGGGTVELLGANTFTGPVRVTGGSILQVSADSALGAAPGAATPGRIVIDNGTLLAYTGFTIDPNRGIALGSAFGAGTGTISVGYGQTLTYNGVIASTSGGGALVVTGGGNGAKLVLGGANTYSGGTTVTGTGLLSIAADAALGAAPGSPTVGNVVLNNGTLAVTGSFTLNANRGIAVGPTSFTGGGTIDVAAGQTLTYNGVVANNGGGNGALTKTGAGTLVLGGLNTYTAGTNVYGGVLSVGLLANAGTASNVGTGGLGFNNGGTLRYTGPAVSTDRTITLNGSGAIDASGTGPLSFTNTGTIANGTGPFTLTLTGTNTGANTLAAALGNGVGGTGLVKSGIGTWVLTGNNTYSGGTTVTAGTLLVNGQVAPNSGTGTGPVAVTGGTFGGTGRVGGAVTVSAGGTLRPGDITATGTLTLNGGLTMAAGSALAVRINAAGTAGVAPGSGGSSNSPGSPTNHNYLVGRAGTFTIDPGMTVVVDGTGVAFTPFSTYSYKVAQLTGDESGVHITDPGQFSFVGFAAQSPRLDGDSLGGLYLSFTPVPEPAAALGLAAGLLGLARAGRRG